MTRNSKLFKLSKTQKNSLHLIWVNLASTFLNFFSGAIIAAALGPFARGIFQSWRILTSITSDLGNFGLGRFISSRFELEGASFRGLYKHVFIVFSLSMSLIPFMLHLKFSTIMIVVYFVLVPVGIFTEIYTGILVRNGNYKIVALWSFLVVAGGSFLTIIYFGLGILTLNLLIASSGFLIVIGLSFGIKNVRFPRGTQSIYSHYRQIIPIYLSNVLKTIFLYLDQILVISFLEVTDLGIYAMAIAAANVSAIFTNYINTVIPSVAKREYIKQKFLAWLLLGYVMASICAYLFSSLFLETLVLKTIGESFLPIVGIVPILFLGNLLRSYVQVLISWSMYEINGKQLLTEKVLNAVGVVFSALFFIDHRSIESAAAMTVITFVPSLCYLGLAHFCRPRLAN